MNQLPASRDQAPAARRHAVLVYPRTGIDVPGASVFMPLAVTKLAAALRRHGWSVVTIDMRTRHDWSQCLSRALEHGPALVGISAMTGEQLKWGLAAAARVRRQRPRTPLIWGGIHAGILPEQTLQDPHVDAVVAGPGEQLLVQLAEALAAGRREDVVDRVHKAPLASATAGLEPTPAYGYDHIDWHAYMTPVTDDVRGLAHVSSRGCPHRCAFCYNAALNGSTWHADEPDRVLAQLAQLVDLDVHGVLFFDDNFFVSRQRVEAIAQGILARGWNLTVKADCRADYILRYDDDFLQLLRRAGIAALYIGGESGSDRMLERLHKDCDVATIVEANRKLARHGIRPHYSFMAGLPGESSADIKATLDLMLRLKEDNPAAYLSPLKQYLPYPGTELYQEAQAAGFRPPDSLQGWSALSWNRRDMPWLNRKQQRYVEKAMYVSLGLDPSVTELSGIKRNRFLNSGFERFTRLCRRRCRRPDLGLVPELPMVRLVRRLQGL